MGSASRYRPKAADLDRLAVAWNAYLEDADDAVGLWDDLADAIRVVLGRGKSAARIALEAATATNILDLPKVDQAFKAPDSDG